MIRAPGGKSVERNFKTFCKEDLEGCSGPMVDVLNEAAEFCGGEDCVSGQKICVFPMSAVLLDFSVNALIGSKPLPR